MKNLCLTSLISLASVSSLCGQISLTDSGYSQDFESLNTSVGLHDWTDNSTLPGWYATTGNPGDTDYRASNGNNQRPQSGTPPTALFLFRATGTDGALGSVSDSSYQASFGAQFVNNTGAGISALTISYTGEQWNWNTSSDFNTLVFAYSTDATSFTNGAWTDVSELSFTALYAGGTGAGLNGNADTIFNGSTYVDKTAGQAGGLGALNYSEISFIIEGLNIANGETFWIRWSDDFSGTGYGQGLGVDNLSISAIPEPATLALSLSGLALALAAWRKRARQ